MANQDDWLLKKRHSITFHADCIRGTFSARSCDEYARVQQCKPDPNGTYLVVGRKLIKTRKISTLRAGSSVKISNFSIFVHFGKVRDVAVSH
jgi:hypothetical protein